MISEPQDLQNSLENESIQSLTAIKQEKDAVAKLENDLRDAQELSQTPQPKPVNEEFKAKNITEVPIPQQVLPVPNLEDDS